MVNFDPFIEAVKQQMQPAERVKHLVDMLQQLSAFTPDVVTLSDLMAGWQFLARPQSQNEAASVTHRRKIYAELAAIAAQFTSEPGDLSQAVRTWQDWRNAFQNSADSHQNTMAKTLTRELAELQSNSENLSI